MARVGTKPMYSREAESKLALYEDLTSSAHGGRLRRWFESGAEGEPFELSDMARPDNAHSAAVMRMWYAHDTGRKVKHGGARDRVIWSARCWEAIRGTAPGFDVISGDLACFELMTLVLTGELDVSDTVTSRMSSICSDARNAAYFGMVASLVSPGAADAKIKQVALFDTLCDKYPVQARAMALSREMRGAYMSPNASKSEQSGSDPDVTSCSIGDHSLARYIEGVTMYWVSGMSFVVVEKTRTILVLDKEHYTDLARCLWMSGMWILYGLNYHGEHGAGIGEVAARDSLSYVVDCLVEFRGDVVKLTRIASHLKSAYSAVQSSYHIGEEADQKTMAAQVQAMIEDSLSRPHTGGGWAARMSRWPEAVQIDFGQVWQVLPVPDIDPMVLNEGLKEKFEKPRVYSDEAWDNFLGYSAGVMSAHIILGKSVEELPVSWTGPDEDPESLQWVIDCRSGKLHYPPRVRGLADTNRIVKSIPWKRHLEQWHWTVSDVTHVNADLDSHSSEPNELLYALAYGRTLSTKFSPEEVRAAMAEGVAPGVRVGVIAGKAENTKHVGKQRDTHSGDDVLRELLTELDINAAQIIRTVYGVAMRAGRRNLEMNIGGIVCSYADGAIIISLDVTGWSPNAPREKELAFIDLVAEMFEAPAGFVPSKIFKDYYVVIERMGYSDRWLTSNGSVQGFFGGADSIMHSMMMRWAFVRAREGELFPRDALLRSIAMIDDMLASVKGVQEDAAKIIKAIASNYSSLGYEVDAVKTMISSIKGHFLNRYYAMGLEVVTASKVWAKIDREWDRELPTCWEVLDSVFGAAAGASDRGADPVACYAVSHMVALEQACAMGYSGKIDTLMHDALRIWLPRAVGGWGMPNYAQWLTRESFVTLDSGLTTVCNLVRCLVHGAPKTARTLYSALHVAISQPLSKRSAIAVLDDPYGVKVAGTGDPATVVRSALKSALDKAVSSTEWRAMIDQGGSEDYLAMIEEIITEGGFHAAIISEFASCLPHSVIRSILTRVERNETILRDIPFKERREAKKNLHRENKLALNHRFSEGDYREVPDSVLISGTQLAAGLRERQRALDGHNMVNLYLPSVLDMVTLSRSNDEAFIRVFAQDQVGLYSGKQGDSMVRTMESRSVLSSMSDQSRAIDPVLETYSKMCAIKTLALSMGCSVGMLEQAYSLAMFGSVDAIQIGHREIRTQNPLRLASRMAKRQYSVMAFPNSAARVKVDVSAAINLLGHTRHGIDFLAVVATMRAWAITSLSIGVPLHTREFLGFSLRNPVLYMIQSTVHSSGSQLLTGKYFLAGALHGESKANALEYMGETYSAVIGALIDEEDGEMGADQYLIVQAAQKAGPIRDASSTSATFVRKVLAREDVGGALAGAVDKRAKQVADIEAPKQGRSTWGAAISATSDPDTLAFLGLCSSILTSKFSVSMAKRWGGAAKEERVMRGAQNVGRSAFLSRVASINAQSHEEIKRSIEKHLGVSGQGSASYYATMAARYKDDERDTALSAPRRTKAHFAAAVMQSWVRARLDGMSARGAMFMACLAFDEACRTLVRRDIPHFECRRAEEFASARGDRLDVLHMEPAMDSVLRGIPEEMMSSETRDMLKGLAKGVAQWVVTDWERVEAEHLTGPSTISPAPPGVTATAGTEEEEDWEKLLANVVVPEISGTNTDVAELVQKISVLSDAVQAEIYKAIESDVVNASNYHIASSAYETLVVDLGMGPKEDRLADIDK